MKILAAHDLGHEPAQEDSRFLSSRLAAGRREVWEGNVGAHTLALLALHHTDPDSLLITAGIDALLGVRNPDGGLPFMRDHTHFLSAVAALALARCALPEHRELVRNIGDYLAAHQNPDGGWAYTERVAQCDAKAPRPSSKSFTPSTPPATPMPCTAAAPTSPAWQATTAAFPPTCSASPPKPS
ncbi:hypothetical protein AB0F03_35070 [Streptomyces sp. NPDC028722]|uniref:hypothetical protein n=1 Tax=Streptomyces sp. NPDC028722 TaxID=3155016 RepID=UPI0033C924A3